MNDFDSIYREFQSKIHRYLCRLSNQADATDLTQEVFLKVSQALDTFRGESSLATWIYRIATNTVYDHARSSPLKQRKLEILFDDADPTFDLPGPDLPGTDKQIILKEMNECIRGIVDQLPQDYRTVLILSEFDEFTNPEIAGILGVSVETIKIRLHRARARLRKAMECQCSLYRDERNELMCDPKAAG
jgi:RNA polymerase sigma-70 factor (ECF subfamily)